jgi:hypothetical protein
MVISPGKSKNSYADPGSASRLEQEVKSIVKTWGMMNLRGVVKKGKHEAAGRDRSIRHCCLSPNRKAG